MPAIAPRSGEAIFASVERVNVELFTLTYGAIVRQLLTVLEEVDEVNKQLDLMYAICGLSGGESKDSFWRIVPQCTAVLPEDKPRYVMMILNSDEKKYGGYGAINTNQYLQRSIRKRKENLSITFTDIGKIMEEKWRNMSAAEREPYEAKAQADKKRYLDEIVEYNYHQEPNKTASRYLSWHLKVLKTRDDKDEDFITNSLGVVSSADNFVEDSDTDDVNDSSSANENGVKLRKGMEDPNTTKCPMVAFLCFSRAEQENTKKENPSAIFTDIGRILGEKWSSDAEKEPYEAMAQADRERHVGRK